MGYYYFFDNNIIDAIKFIIVRNFDSSLLSHVDYCKILIDNELLRLLFHRCSTYEFSPRMRQWLAICHLNIPGFHKKGTTEWFFKDVIVVPRYWLFRFPLLLYKIDVPFFQRRRKGNNKKFIIGSIVSQLLLIIHWLLTIIVLVLRSIVLYVLSNYFRLSLSFFIFRWQAECCTQMKPDNAIGYQIVQIYILFTYE